MESVTFKKYHSTLTSSRWRIETGIRPRSLSTYQIKFLLNCDLVRSCSGSFEALQTTEIVVPSSHPASHSGEL